MVLNLKPLFIGDDNCMQLDNSLKLEGGERELSFLYGRLVQVIGTIESKTGIVTLSIRCEVDFSELCDRCGVEFNRPYSVEINRVLVTMLHGEDNDSLLAVEDMQLDLSELIRTEMILNLPMKHLCKPDCKGICYQCGSNLNEGDCGCDRRKVDPRLEALKALL